MDKKIKEVKILKDIYCGDWITPKTGRIVPQDKDFVKLYSGKSFLGLAGVEYLEFWLSCGCIEVVYEDEVRGLVESPTKSAMVLQMENDALYGDPKVREAYEKLEKKLINSTPQSSKSGVKEEDPKIDCAHHFDYKEIDEEGNLICSNCHIRTRAPKPQVELPEKLSEDAWHTGIFAVPNLVRNQNQLIDYLKGKEKE